MRIAVAAANATSNIKFDKVVVWDGGNGKGGTAGFLQGLARSLPPMLDVMRDIGGIEMPEALGKIIGSGEPADGKPAAPRADVAAGQKNGSRKKPKDSGSEACPTPRPASNLSARP